MLKSTLIISLFFCITTLFGQRDIAFSKANFPHQKKELKAALKNIEDGDYYFSLGNSNVEIALDYYLRANKLNPNNASLNYKLGLCYLEAKPASKSIYYLIKAKRLNPKVNEDYNLYLAKAYHLNLEFDKAIHYYQIYRDNLSPEKANKQLDIIDHYIEECKNGKELVKKPVRVFVENLGPAINSEYPDYGAVVNIDESMIFFTSRRPTTTGGERNPLDMMYYEDTY